MEDSSRTNENISFDVVRRSFENAFGQFQALENDQNNIYQGMDKHRDLRPM